MLQITISKRAALIIGVALLLVIPGVATATHIFTDVGDGSTHAEGIEWVANAGVTAGCGDGTQYCPNDAVNRAQMGTFMCRLAGKCGVAPSVDAATLEGNAASDFLGATDQAADSDTVDGNHATALAGTTTHWYMAEPVTLTSGTNQVVATVEVDAPSDGSLLITAQTSVYDTTDVVWLEYWVQLDNGDCDAGLETSIARGFEFLDGAGDDELDSIHVMGAVNVDAGAHTVTFCVEDYSGNGGDPSMFSSGITVQHSAAAATTATVLGNRSSAAPGE